MELDGSDSEIGGFRINKDYAEKYDKWRQKEELQKLKDRYGDVDNESSSTSESEDEDAEALTDKLENEWLQTLAALKKKDPKIYDKEVQFFEIEDEENTHSEKEKKKKKEKPFLLKDYERAVIIERGGKLSDDDTDEENDAISKHLPQSYYKEQLDLKNDFKAAINDDGEDSGDEFLTKRKKTKEDEKREAEDYTKWLKIQKKEENIPAGIDPWDKPDLNEGDKFLRDYILNKKYIDEENEDRVPTYDEIVNVEDEEEELEKEEEFERKFNFRYEEPDQDFIKSYPRTIGESVRRKDNKRARKRQEAKEKKDRDKEQKREELKQLKNLKKREILDKIEMIREVTGNADIAFSANDIDEDFDPGKYDEMMMNAFNENYYDEDVDDKKPVFNDEEVELDIELDNWDKWTPDVNTEAGVQRATSSASDGHIYSGSMEEQEEENDEWDLTQISKKKKRKRSKFAKAVMRKKPVFDPSDRTFEEYLDEYYKLDYEDMIGDQPCRFKYRSVVANDFGLTTDDVLKAPERELNQWVSVKKMSQYRTKEEEVLDVKIYQKKSKRKQNVLVSLNETEKQSLKSEKENSKKAQRDGSLNRKFPKKSSAEISNNSKKRKYSHIEDSGFKSTLPASGGFIKKPKIADNVTSTSKSGKGVQSAKLKMKNKKKKQKLKGKKAMSDERLRAYGINPKKFKYMKDKHTKAKL